MRDSASVISQAVKGIDIADLAREFDVSEPRMYEILSTSSPYPRTKTLIKAIGKFSRSGARLIKADLDAMFSEILGESTVESSEIELHREAFEAVQACLEKKPKAERMKELREVISVAQGMLSALDAEPTNVKEFAREVTVGRVRGNTRNERTTPTTKPRQERNSNTRYRIHRRTRRAGVL